MGQSSIQSIKQSTALPANFVASCAERGLLPTARIYGVVRCLDGDGRGWIAIPSLRRALSQLKSPATASRWIALLAANPDFATVTIRNDDGGRLHLRAPETILDRWGLFASRTTIHPQLAGLIAPSWRGELHLSVLATRNDYPTSRETSERRSGVRPTAQRNAERSECVKVLRNCRRFAPDDPAAPSPNAPGVIVLGNGHLQEQIPNSYHVERRVTRRTRRSTPAALAGAASVQRRYFSRSSSCLGRRWRIDRGDIAGDTVTLLRGRGHRGWTIWT